ncbi:[Fe-Fe] hydrogenase large subunit C-terminal domain-containing protein [Desulfoluna spongiiphila]|uniref:[Fe-Fe] hydrogenase large subunit C-terminal domain-containing protein n=1 Tax=Desulfoluna spongiiphila TaxID=419481 RepID=UPI00125FE3B5|nr:[Fe-Fe] hydrogenase large subunit C-terminal domain-containing protein [Desulfoluna spongiiphila]
MMHIEHDGAGCYVSFDTALCDGCTRCVRGCPTKALRVRKGKVVHKQEACIGCGNCLRICPMGVVRAATTELSQLKKSRISVALVTPILYAQFPGVLPKDILKGLKRLGFHHTVDMSYFFEMFQFATEEFIRQNRRTQEAPWPLISPVCPVVLRLIQTRFPSLIPHIHPIKRPVALMAKKVTRILSKHYGVNEGFISMVYINPCPTKKGDNPSTPDQSFTNGGPYAMGICDIYSRLAKEVEHVRNIEAIPMAFASYEFEQCTSGDGLLWGMSGGETVASDIEKSLSVSGLDETVSMLEKIEMGLFRDTEYIELRACTEGCLGGALTAIDKYLAKSASQRMITLLGTGKRLNRDRINRLYEKEWFFSKRAEQGGFEGNGFASAPFTIEEMRKIDGLIQLINGRDCAACGAPDCRTFAEDVVRGEAPVEACLLLRARGLSGEQVMTFINSKECGHACQGLG